MKQILGYFLGFAIFIAGIPAMMWRVAGWPAFAEIPAWRLCVAGILALAGLALSIWSIVYMKRVGKGNPFDAMGHELAPRTRHLMTGGPYRLSRNPMLSGTYLYYLGIVLTLWNGRGRPDDAAGPVRRETAGSRFRRRIPGVQKENRPLHHLQMNRNT